MAAPKGTSAATNLVIEEFEPYCKWQREEARDTLIISLPEFKKEQLRVHINNRGILKVSGERSIDASRRSKFYKEVAVPPNCNTSGIQAKFANNQLFIILPKLPADSVIPEESKPQQDSGKGEAAPTQAPPVQGGGEVATVQPATSSGTEVGKTVLNAGMVFALMAAILAFVVYMYKSTIVED